MSEQKGNCELNNPTPHDDDEDKVDSPESFKPVDYSLHNVTGLKEPESATCDHSRNNGESGFRDSVENNRHLDSVLEYASRIRAFVGFDDGDDSKEIQPPPLPKPLVIDKTPGAVDRNSIIDGESDSSSVGSSEQINGVSDRDKSGDEPYRDEPVVVVNSDPTLPETASTLDLLVSESKYLVIPDSDTCVPDSLGVESTNIDEPNIVVSSKPSLNESSDTLDVQNIGIKDTDIVETAGLDLCAPDQIPDDDRINNDKPNAVVDPESSSLYISLDAVDDQNKTEKSMDGDRNVENPDQCLPVTTDVNSEPELMDKGLEDGVSKTPPVQNSCDNIEKKVNITKKAASVQLKNCTSLPSIPYAMINNGFIGDMSITSDGKKLIKNKNVSTEVLFHKSTNNDSLKEVDPVIEKNNPKKTKSAESLSTKENLETDFKMDGMEGIENAGFENDIPECSNNELTTNEDANIAVLDSNTSNLIGNVEELSSDKATENQHLKDTIAGKTAEVFLFDPEYVEELQKECLPEEDDEVKPIPDMAVLRRLSMDVVNKVLDDAGNQIREILDERKRSNIELNNLVSNAEELMDFRTGNDKLENGKLTDSGSESNSKQNEIQLKDVLAKTYDFQDFQKKIESEMNKFDPRYDIDPDTVCGIGSFTPKWIQPYATAKTYLVLYSIIGMLSGCYYTYLIGTISTLEKRFAFKSKVSGTIMIVDEITPLFLGVLIGYFGGKAHRPRMVGLGMLLSAICCFVSALPYFIYGPATHLNNLNVKNDTNMGTCGREHLVDNCDADDRPPTLAAILFLMFGSFLKGFGNLAYYAVGLAYLDDISKKKDTPMFFAVTMALRLVGPFLGFLLSSACLKYHENPFDDPGFGPEDPRWIGGWWMGFLLQGFLLLIFTIPISLFPKKLPGNKKQSRESEAMDHIPNFKGLLAALKRLGKNVLFVFIVINTIVSIFGGFGHYIMLPKYMENQFHLSASNASLFSGPPGLAAVMIATLIGGYLIWKFKPSPRILTAGMLTVEVIAAIGFLLLMIPRCERVQMTNFGFTDEGLILDAACNANCNCTTSAFTPVCGPDGRTTYFSPCHAGCTESANKTFSNCSCVSDSIEKQVVTEGYCMTEGCWTQTLAFIITLPILQFVVSLMRVAHTMILLRSVKPEDKSIALGTFETFLCAFGFIPFPVVYGAIVDSTCLVWESSCGKTGNCWFYDVDKFNYFLHGASAGFSSLSVLCLIVIFFLSARVNNLYADDHELNKDTKGSKEKVSSESRL